MIGFRLDSTEGSCARYANFMAILIHLDIVRTHRYCYGVCYQCPAQMHSSPRMAVYETKYSISKE
jgi:hypothetical protein